MNKSELIRATAARTHITQIQAKELVEAVFDTIVDGLLANDTITIQGFGVFTVTHRAIVRNPKSGKHVPGKKNIRFTISKVLRTLINPND